MTRHAAARWLLRVAAPVLATWLVVACASADKLKPTPLENVASPQALGRKAWTVSLDGIGFPLSPAVSGGTVALASGRGTVVLVKADDGSEVWRADVGAPIAAGTGNDGRRVAVVTRNNELVVLDGGRVLWRDALPTRVSTAPLVAGERVFVLGVDRSIHAFDALDGARLWSSPRPPGDALGLVHNGLLEPYKNVLLAGQGPRLALVDSVRGSVGREVALTAPRGTNEVERLADLVGPPARVGDVVCTRAFQASIGCIDVARGTLVWSKTVTGSQGLGGDATLVVGGDANDRVTAWKANSGDTAWSHERVMHRGLSGAVVLPKAVVFGDGDGVLHFFDRATGATLQQLPTDGGAALGTPVRAGRHVVVVKRNGLVHGIAVD